MIDGFDGEWYDEEDEDETSIEKLEEILHLTNRYYPADRVGVTGIGDWRGMRAQAACIEDELERRAAWARQEDAIEMRNDDERV